MEKEARAVASLDDPNIVKIHEVRRDSRGLPAIVLEFLGGGTLADKLKSGPLPPIEVAILMEKISSGVAAAHRAGLIHRDLKPANVLLTETGEPKVADFGLARIEPPASCDESSVDAFVGTPTYTALEQARNRI